MNGNDGQIQRSSPFYVDGTVIKQRGGQRQVQWSKGTDVVSATALPLGTDGNYFDITAANTITSINTLGVGTAVMLHFDATPTLTHHATDLILPGGANIITAAGDEAIFVEYAIGDWRCISYTKAVTSYADATVSGTPRIAPINIDGAEYYFKVYPTKA